MATDLAAFRAALPQFAAVADDTVTLYLGMAGRSMGGGFGDAAQDANVFLAAHLMSMAGIGPGAQANQLAGFTSIKAGSLTLTRSEKAAAGEYAASPYGVLFWRIKAARAPGVGFMVTGTGSLPVDDAMIYAPPHGQD